MVFFVVFCLYCTLFPTESPSSVLYHILFNYGMKRGEKHNSMTSDLDKAFSFKNLIES